MIFPDDRPGLARDRDAELSFRSVRCRRRNALFRLRRIVDNGSRSHLAKTAKQCDQHPVLYPSMVRRMGRMSRNPTENESIHQLKGIKQATGGKKNPGINLDSNSKHVPKEPNPKNDDENKTRQTEIARIGKPHGVPVPRICVACVTTRETAAKINPTCVFKTHGEPLAPKPRSIANERISLFSHFLPEEVFQSFNLIDELNVYENIELPLRYMNIGATERKERVTAIMKRMAISHRAQHFPQQLSGGQQQRVAIARAVVANPKLILADEPTGNLDSKNGKEVMELLTDLHKEGTTIVMVTHSQRDAGYADRIINLFDGKIVEDVLQEL